MTANMYRVGDYVYFETSSTSPYQIRRIEELNKTASGNVEAKVMCFYRRRDLPSPLIQLADKHQSALDETSGLPERLDGLTPKQRHQMKHRELFLSRQVETLPATHIRGKCSVTLFNETEALSAYLNKEDTFFYCLVFDPTQKTLLADKGEIRVGSRYQSDVTFLLKEGEKDDRDLRELETLIWTPEHDLTDRQIDQFLVVARSVGTFARALDCSSSVKQPSLHMSAAAASRDITLFHAMDTLHRHDYDLANAMCSLVPSSGPVLCRDEMEEWSASEANLFEEALDKYGKDFNDIRQDFLPWKTLKNIIEYYYMWKTTDRYVQQKRVKAVEAESKLKQVYIPNYNKPNPAALNNNKGIINGNGNNGNGNSEQQQQQAAAAAVAAVSLGGKSCESCNVTASGQWYAWGPSHMQCRLCQQCWNYWKRYGGLKVPTRFGDGGEFDPLSGRKKTTNSDGDEEKSATSLTSQHRPHRCNVANCAKEFKLKAHLGRHYATAHGIMVRSGSPRPIMKTRTAFYLCTTPLTRISRRLCRHIMRPRHAARAPFFPINIQAVKQECSVQVVGKTVNDLRHLLIYKRKTRKNVTNIATRLGNPGVGTPQWLILTDKEKLPKPERVAFPKPPKAPDGSLLYERVPNKIECEKMIVNAATVTPIGGTTASSIYNNVVVQQQPSSIERQTYEEMNGIVDGTIMGPPTKKFNKDPSISMVRGVSGGPSASDPYAAAMSAAAIVSPGTQVLPRQIAQINGKPKIAHMTRTGTGRKQVISWMDAPDDVYFRATEGSKKVRRQVTSTELRRAARKPWRALKSKIDDLQVVVLD